MVARWEHSGASEGGFVAKKRHHPNHGSAARAADRVEGAVEDAVEDAADSKVLHTAARAGYVATGLIHFFIGLIALRIAGGSAGVADQSGAVAQLAATPGGSLLLWICFVACAALAAFMASQVFFGWKGSHGARKLKKKLKAAGQSLLFGAAAGTFYSFANGQPTNSREKSQTFSADMMASTPGTFLLYALGAGLLAAGCVYGFLGVTRRYEKALRGKPAGNAGRAFTAMGVFGYCAKGLALLAVGLLVIVATARHDPSQSGGLDAALKAFLEQPFGVWVLMGVGVGLMGYGVFSVFRSRYQRL
ncbi:DUF1206 domain-containing protein [Arthrobacter sp. ISL-30]|nr:DUF1206 domain-containing protein [Arthrobacter sp. ISL-30]